MLLTATQVRPLPETVGWFGSVLMPVLLDTVSSIKLLLEGETEAVAAVELPSVSVPEVKFEIDTAIIFLSYYYTEFYAALIFQVNCKESPFTTFTAVKVCRQSKVPLVSALNTPDSVTAMVAVSLIVPTS